MSKLWSKYENWSKLGKQNRVYRYRSNVYRYTLVQNDQNPKCTGTGSRCTGTGHLKMPRMCVFVTFFHILILKSTLHFKHTSKPFQIHFVIYFYSNLLPILIFFQNPSINFSQYHSNMGYDPYTNQAPRLVRVCSKP